MIIGVNSEYVAEFGYGNHDDASFSVSEKLSLKEGNNTLDILSMMIGVQVQISVHVDNLSTDRSRNLALICLTPMLGHTASIQKWRTDSMMYSFITKLFDLSCLLR